MQVRVLANDGDLIWSNGSNESVCPAGAEAEGQMLKVREALALATDKANNQSVSNTSPEKLIAKNTQALAELMDS